MSKCDSCFYRAFRKEEDGIGTAYEKFCYVYFSNQDRATTCNSYIKANCSNCEYGKKSKVCTLTKKPVFKTKICSDFRRYQGWGFDVKRSQVDA